MEYLIGVILTLAVAAFAFVVGFDRERAAGVGGWVRGCRVLLVASPRRIRNLSVGRRSRDAWKVVSADNSHTVVRFSEGCLRVIMSTATHAPKTTSDAKQKPGHHCGTPGLSMKK